MNELNEIRETSNRLKELISSYSENTQKIKNNNQKRIEDLYSQILDYIKNTLFPPYKEFYTQYHNKEFKIAWVSSNISCFYYNSLYLRASDSTFENLIFDTSAKKVTDADKQQIVLHWQKIKEQIIKEMEEHKRSCLSSFEYHRKLELELSSSLDAFKL
ncbi:MAG: hypothetical protein J6P28_03590 [Treponema sp.]|nr:hypothetical protein [Treponema sp.]